MRLTPRFWTDFEMLRLQGEFGGAYRMLERPLGSGRNAYIDAINKNFSVISERLAALGPQ